MYTIIAPYDSFKHFEVPINEYIKRLWKHLEIIKIKPSKKDSIEEAKREDTRNITEKLNKTKGYKILLDINGKSFDTVYFLEFIQKQQQEQANIVFVIGGVYGYTEDLYQNIDYKFSLSSLTFPHNMAFLILLEQIYRIESIKSGKQYHY